MGGESQPNCLNGETTYSNYTVTIDVERVSNISGRVQNIQKFQDRVG